MTIFGYAKFFETSTDLHNLRHLTYDCLLLLPSHFNRLEVNSKSIVNKQ